MINKLINKCREMGIMEVFLQEGGLVVRSIFSRIVISVLQIRGYTINTTVQLGKSILWFADTKGAITIQDHVVLGSFLRLKAAFKGTIHLGKDVFIDDFGYISSFKGAITIGTGTLIGAYCYIVNFDHIFPIKDFNNKRESKDSFKAADIHIGKYVWIGAHVKILKGVTIGDNAVIGAGAVVTKDIPANSIAVGSPAKVIKTI